MKSDSVPSVLPRHIAFIMDGNGRWAKKRFLPRKAGHREGVKTLRKIVDTCFSIGIPHVTLYAFSTENRERPSDEIENLFSLLKEYFSDFFEGMLRNNVRITVMGELSYFPADLRKLIEEAVQKSRECTSATLNIALNYGSRTEIVRAANIAVTKGKAVNETEFARLLYTTDLPDPDLIVRTGGECRLSNFMLYQCAYSELVFVKTLWPDFGKKELYAVLNDYASRDRRFGKIKQ